MAKRLTQEEKVAQKLTQAVSDVTLDLEAVGMYIAQASPSVAYRRLELIVEVAEQEREGNNGQRDYIY